MVSFRHVDRFADHGSWWGALGVVVPLLLFLIVIAVVVWAVLRLTGRGVAATPALASASGTGPGDAALEEVRIRYARGEISREEFVQRSRDLGGMSPESGEPSPPAGG